MKKLFLSIALVAMTLSLASCGGDEPVPEVTVKETITGKELINWTVKAADNSTNFVETADYTFNIERGKNEATVSVLAQGVQFDSHMPIQVSFRMEDIKTTTFDENHVKFSAASVKFYDPETGEENTRYTLTNVKGFVDKTNNVYSLDYTVNGTWRVLVFNSTVSTVVTNNDYNAATDLYYTYKIDVASMKAEVFIYNVQFEVGGAMSPVLKKISIPDLDVAFTTEDFGSNEYISPVIKVTGDNIVPTYYTGANLDQGTPYPSLVVTNFKTLLDVTSGGSHTIYFNCHGGEHKMNNKLFLWE